VQEILEAHAEKHGGGDKSEHSGPTIATVEAYGTQHSAGRSGGTCPRCVESHAGEGWRRQVGERRPTIAAVRARAPWHRDRPICSETRSKHIAAAAYGKTRGPPEAGYLCGAISEAEEVRKSRINQGTCKEAYQTASIGSRRRRPHMEFEPPICTQTDRQPWTASGLAPAGPRATTAAGRERRRGTAKGRAQQTQ
jgi:hypothetical protein